MCLLKSSNVQQAMRSDLNSSPNLLHTLLHMFAKRSLSSFVIFNLFDTNNARALLVNGSISNFHNINGT